MQDQLFGKVRILSLSKTTGIKLTLQENVSANSFMFRREHVVNGNTMLFYVQVRREHTLNGNTVLFQSKTNLTFPRENPKIFGDTMRPNSQKMVLA